MLKGAKAALAQTTRQRATGENAMTLLVGQPQPADLSAGVVSNDLDTLFIKGTSVWTFAPQLLKPILGGWLEIAN